jgi:hypothetical protein
MCSFCEVKQFMSVGRRQKAAHFSTRPSHS